MTTKTLDGKLARELQKRGTWTSYSACLNQVRQALTTKTSLEVRQAINEGKLDPIKMVGKKKVDQ